MTGRRNRMPTAKSTRERDLIRNALLSYSRAHPLSRPPTAAELRQMTGLTISERRVQQHIASIRVEQQLRELLDDYLASSQPEGHSQWV